MCTNACSKPLTHLLGTVPVWELEDIHSSCQNILLISIRNLVLSVLYIALSSEIVFIVFFAFAALYCTSFWLCFLCLLFDVRLSHLINITYIHTYIVSARLGTGRGGECTHPPRGTRQANKRATRSSAGMLQYIFPRKLPSLPHGRSGAPSSSLHRSLGPWEM